MNSRGPDSTVEGKASAELSQERAQQRSPTPEQLAALAEKILGVRGRRAAFLGGDHISEPGWEILIALYQAHAASHRMTVSNACRASHAPSTTALRWLDRLVELGLVRRENNPIDARVVFIELEPKARIAMHDYFNEIWLTLHGAD